MCQCETNEKVNELIEKKQYYHSYQPLFRFSDWELVGYEAFFRCESFTPEVLFTTLLEQDLMYELDTTSIYEAITSYAQSMTSAPKNLFVNILPSTLLHPSLPSFLEKLQATNSVPNRYIIFEINEAEQITDYRAFGEAVRRLRQDGFRIALDDVGKGVASLQRIVEVEPDYIKLDRYFATDLSSSEKKQRMIQLLVTYCRNHTFLILEGIETPEDLAAAKVLGVDIGQGYVLGKPGSLHHMNS
ncbi:EAL domain-containing protein [Brevibacillus sp. B_LB10_24]|uniref:EAL domain-containing protein n=1 Tax=Brevibacillus sp. B_LB10_24 TaxID=3380645 RepID=UPI0038BA8EA4